VRNIEELGALEVLGVGLAVTHVSDDLVRSFWDELICS
jgi:hypothetical protein